MPPRTSASAGLHTWNRDGTLTVLPTGEITTSSGFESEPAVFVDAASGDDSAGGTTEETALASFDEYRRRLGRSPIDVAQTVTLIGDVQGDVVVDPSIGPGGSLIVRGSRTPIYASTLSAVTPWDPPTLTEGAVEDAALPTSWTASGLVGMMLTFEDLPPDALGRRPWSWVARDLGARRARYAPAFSPAIFANVVPAPGQPFAVQRLTRVQGALVTDPRIVGEGSVRVLDLWLDTPGIGASLTGDAVSVEGCLITVRAQAVAGNIGLTGCRTRQTETFHGARLTANALFSDGPTVGYEQSIFESSRQLLSHGAIQILPQALLRNSSWAATFDTDSGIIVHTGANVVAAGKLWGRGITSDCVAVVSDGCIAYNPTEPADYQHGPGVTEVRVGGTELTFAAVAAGPGYVNPTNLARMVETVV